MLDASGFAAVGSLFGLQCLVLLMVVWLSLQYYYLLLFCMFQVTL